MIWIKTSKEYPPMHQRVLVFIEKDRRMGKPMIRIASIDRDLDWIDECGYACEPDAWCRLPEVPE